MKGPGTPEYDNDLTAIASLDLERPSSLDLVTPWAWLFDFPRFPGLAKYLSFLFCFPSPPKCINENETGNYCSYQQSTFSLGRERSYQSKNYSWILKCTAGKLEGSSVDRYPLQDWDQNLHTGASCPVYVWWAVLSPISSCFSTASHPQASQTYLSSNLSNRLSLTTERSPRLLFPVYTTFTSCAHQITVVRVSWNAQYCHDVILNPLAMGHKFFQASNCLHK